MVLDDTWSEVDMMLIDVLLTTGDPDGLRDVESLLGARLVLVLKDTWADVDTTLLSTLLPEENIDELSDAELLLISEDVAERVLETDGEDPESEDVVCSGDDTTDELLVTL